MTWTAVGVWQGENSTNLSLSNQGVGDLIVAEVINFSGSGVWCTGFTGGGVTWVQAGVKFSGSTNAFSAAVFLGTVTATGAQVATVTWSGTAPGSFGIASREFTSSVGSWSFVTQGNLDSAGTNNWPSLTANAGDLYFGYAANNTAAANGSPTSGYTYNISADSVGNGAAFNPSCPSGATFPAWTDGNQALGIAVLIREGGAAAPAPPALPARPGATWLRRFQHRQILAPPPPPPAPVPPPPPAPPVTALPGRTWLRRFQHRQILAPGAAPVQPYIAGLGGTGYSSWFQDQYGSPRLAVIEQAWALPFNAGRFSSGNYQADFTSYFSHRAAQGYTAWYGVAHGSTHIDSTATGGKSWDGVFVLTVNGTPGNISTGSETVALNGAYWSRIDAMFATARQYGISCFLNMGLTYDFSDAGGIWQHATNTQAGQFGAALAARYPQASYPHVFWFFGDDDGGGNDSFWSALLSGMAGAGDTRALTAIEYLTNENSHVEFDNGTAVGTFGAASATYNWVYSYDAPYFGLERSYTEGGSFTHIPPVYGDGIYYGDSGGGPSVETAVRTFVWWALASGSRGFPSTSGPSFADADALWMWATSAATARVITDPNGSWTTTNVGRIATFFGGLADWHKLIPDTSNVFITAGRGTRGTCDAPGGGFNVRTGNTYVAGSITPAGTLAVIYCRAAMSITIDQSKLGAGYTATWVDPANPTLTQSATPGSTYASAGLGTNSAGDPDWVLVLQGPAIAGAANVTGTAAAVTVASPAGSPASAANVTGAAAAVTVASPAGVASGAAGTTGTAANVIAAAPAGVAFGGTSGAANVTGVAAPVTVASPAGVSLGSAGVTGAAAAITAAAPAGAPAGSAGTSGAAALVTAASPAGVLAASAGTTGTAANVTVAASAGVPAAAANITGQGALVTVAAPAGAAFGGTSGAANVTGTAATVTVAAPPGAPSSGNAITGTAAHVTAAGGQGAASVPVSVTGVAAHVTVAATAGTLTAAANVAGLAALTAVTGGTGIATGGVVFTVGTLTAASAPAATLTANAAPGGTTGGTITSGTQRTGGPS